MYQIRCDDVILYDPRDDELRVLNPKCKLEANTVGEGSFTILSNHPNYHIMKMLKSVFEIRDGDHVLFRGRMTEDSADFHNRMDVDLEGILACTNDTMIPPFSFPEDFRKASSAENVVEFFLDWILTQHNQYASAWQQLKLGTVTVADPNNYISRASDKYASTWETLKSKLFDSGLGGYLIIRYEADGNYVDYLESFELTNTQPITLTENLLDIVRKRSATDTFSAILPIGATLDGKEDEEKQTVTLADLKDGDLTDDLVKEGLYIYSKAAREQYGWVCVPVNDSTWDDVTTAKNLRDRAVEYLTGVGMLLSSTITIKAVDLHFTDEQIQSFRIYRNILVNSPVHDVVNASFPLTKLDIDLFNPQNTTITIGDTVRTLIDINDQKQSASVERVEQVAQMVTGTKETIVETVHQQVIVQETSMISTCSEMIFAALDSYVKTGDYEQFKATVDAELKILANEISMNFTSNTEYINNVAGDLQAEVTTRKKHINFSENGITIGTGDGAMSLEIDNNIIKFKRNGVQFGWWDGVDFHTGNIVVDVNERAQFGDFAFIPRSDGSLMFLKVGG